MTYIVLCQHEKRPADIWRVGNAFPTKAAAIKAARDDMRDDHLKYWLEGYNHGDQPFDDWWDEQLCPQENWGMFVPYDFSQLLRLSGKNMVEISTSFSIPYRTLQNWKAGERTPPDYVLDMLAELI